MNWLVVWSIVFLMFLPVTVYSTLFANGRSWLSNGAAKFYLSFFLTSSLGFILTNKSLEVPNPIVITISFCARGSCCGGVGPGFYLETESGLYEYRDRPVRGQPVLCLPLCYA